MRLLQPNEYLSFLPGNRRHNLTPPETRAALDAARALWPATGLSLWDDKPRRVEYALVSDDGSHTVVHITADHKDCFVILVTKTSSRKLVGYIVFDIGAEYRRAIYICPAVGFEGPADERIMRESLPRLNTHRDGFAILEIGAGTYMQTSQSADGRYELEHQLVTVESHYRAVGPIGSSDVITAFASYAFGKKEWATRFTWERIEL